MNIFYLDHDVRKCAEMHNDRHVVKMILEYAQLLSTAHRILDGVLSFGVSPSGRKKIIYVLADNRDTIMYSATHINHPSAIWVRQSAQNYMWLAELLEECCKEYTHRYDKVHKVERDGLMQTLKNNFPINIPDGTFTEPTPAMPEDVKILREVHTDRYVLDSLASYRNYYIQNKTHLANWKKRGVPEWYITK
jgi:Pyrimidine dimer DNA glycosylase